MSKTINILISALALSIYIIIYIIIISHPFNNIDYIQCIINFKSPLTGNTPSQFVFLTCIVTSTLTLAVIGNRLRDRKDILYKEKHEISKELLLIKRELKTKRTSNRAWNYAFIKKLNGYNEHKQDTIKTCRLALHQINIILWTHIVIIHLASLRILLNSFDDSIDVGIIDFFLIFGGFFLFGIMWPCYFLSYGGGKNVFTVTEKWFSKKFFEILKYFYEIPHT